MLGRLQVKYVAVVSTSGDPRSALAVEPDGRALDAGVKLAAAAVLGKEPVQVGEQAHRPFGPRASRVLGKHT